MFGYQEIAYSVERSSDIRTPTGHLQHSEIRVTQPSPNPFAGGTIPPVERYIALMSTGKEGESVMDLLLLYRAKDQQEALDADWERLISKESVNIDELKWSEMVVNHATGYTRDGRVTTY